MLRWYQQDAVTATWDFLCNTPQKNPVVVLPTGAGKSHVIAQLCSDAVSRFDGRVVVLAHRKELLEQNAEKIKALTSAPVGIYSAGLNSRDVESPIVVAGIQSIYDKAHLLGIRQLVIADEAHLIPFDGDGMYQQFLGDLKRYNAGVCRLVGLTATPFRTRGGALCRPDGVFHKVAFDAPMQRLMEEGHLSRLTNQPGEQLFDLSSVSIAAGEFVANQMEQVFAESGKLVAAVKEIIASSAGRKSVLVFCAGVNHADEVRRKMEELAREPVGFVTGQTSPLERCAQLAGFRSGSLRFMVNVDVLTTGFDHPGIDVIAILRATMSPGLFVQMAGRGLRVSPGKRDCLILDFGGNLARHGPIDAVEFGKETGAGKVGEAPVKVCPGCKEEVLIAAKVCPCGFRFPVAEGPGLRHEGEADKESAILDAPEVFQIERVEWARHQKKNAPDAPPTLRIDYFPIGNLSHRVSEWVCVEHEGFARRRAEQWWREHSKFDMPATVDQALAIINAGCVVFAESITVQKRDGFDRILSRVMPELPDVGDAFEMKDFSATPEEIADLPF